MQGMSAAERKELHELVDALPDEEIVAARDYLESLRPRGKHPYSDLPPEERAKLHAAIEQSRADAKAGLGVSADEVLRELDSL